MSTLGFWLTCNVSLSGCSSENRPQSPPAYKGLPADLAARMNPQNGHCAANHSSCGLGCCNMCPCYRRPCGISDSSMNLCAVDCLRQGLCGHECDQTNHDQDRAKLPNSHDSLLFESLARRRELSGSTPEASFPRNMGSPLWET